MSIRSSFLAMREPRFSAFVLTRSGEHITQFGYQVFLRTTCQLAHINLSYPKLHATKCVCSRLPQPLPNRPREPSHNGEEWKSGDHPVFQDGIIGIASS